MCGSCRTTRRPPNSWAPSKGSAATASASDDDVEKSADIVAARDAAPVNDLPVERLHPGEHSGFGPRQQDRVDRPFRALEPPAPPARAAAVKRTTAAKRFKRLAAAVTGHERFAAAATGCKRFAATMAGDKGFAATMTGHERFATTTTQAAVPSLAELSLERLQHETIAQRQPRMIAVIR